VRTPLLLAAGLVLALACSARAQDKENEIITRLKKAKVDGPFTLVVILKVKEGEDKKLVEACKPCIAATRKEPGCVTYELLKDVENARQYVMNERWKSVKDLEDHLVSAHVKKLFADLKDVLEGPPRIALLRSTDKGKE
jgi:quinol monooxygenase YgiN